MRLGVCNTSTIINKAGINAVIHTSTILEMNNPGDGNVDMAISDNFGSIENRLNIHTHRLEYICAYKHNKSQFKLYS